MRRTACCFTPSTAPPGGCTSGSSPSSFLASTSATASILKVGGAAGALALPITFIFRCTQCAPGVFTERVCHHTPPAARRLARHRSAHRRGRARRMRAERVHAEAPRAPGRLSRHEHVTPRENKGPRGRGRTCGHDDDGAAVRPAALRISLAGHHHRPEANREAIPLLVWCLYSRVEAV